MDLKILKLASDTKSQKKISDFTHNSKAKNPLCGDEIQLFFKVNKGKIIKVSYQGKNCVYCQASANLLSSNSNGKKVEEMIEVCDCANEFFKNKGEALFNNVWSKFLKIKKVFNISTAKKNSNVMTSFF